MGSNDKLSDLEMQKALTASQTPTQLLKYSSKGKPLFRDFTLSADFSTLQWESDNRRGDPKTLEISKILEIKFGQRTDKFMKNKRPDLEHLSFSIVYNDSSEPGKVAIDTLDLVCKDEKEFRRWTCMLIALWEKKVSKEIMDNALGRGREDSAMDGHLAKELKGRQSSPEMAKFGSQDSNLNNEKRVAGGLESKTDVSSINSALKSQFEAQNDLYVVGSSDWGQTGQDKFDPIDNPAIIDTLLGKGVQQVCFGWSHSLIVLETGDLTASGNRIGTGFDQDTSTPIVVQFGPQSNQIASVHSGHFHNVALTEFGEVYTWGCGIDGQLGHVDLDDKKNPTRLSVSNKRITAVSCGSNFTVALNETGELYTWGGGTKGNLGHGSFSDEELPRKIQVLIGKMKVLQVSCGDSHVVAVTSAGPYAWGWNSSGQLGVGHFNDVSSPTPIESLKGMEVQSVSCGAAHSAVVVYIKVFDTQGVYVWGSNKCGQLGIGDKEKQDVTKPTVINSLKDQSIVQIDCGAFHTVALSESGIVFSTGLNSHGQLAHSRSNITQSNIFERVPALDGRKVRQVFCGPFNTAVLVARQWNPDSEVSQCQGCGDKFSLIKSKHHCRNCGGIYCAKCSAKKTAILKFGFTQPVRVCDQCYDKLSRDK